MVKHPTFFLHPNPEFVATMEEHGYVTDFKECYYMFYSRVYF
jgi:hypothetical protein